MPRVKASPKKCMKSNIQQPNNSWVILLKGEALELSEHSEYTGSGTPDIVTLKHPKNGKAAVFLFSTANNSVQEILTFSEGKRSWFIDDSVKSDGKMHLSTPVDPIFLVLPYLQKYCASHAVPLKQLLHDEEFPETERLLKSSGLKYLSIIADRKGDEELNAFKYNEEKTLSWLKKKTEKVAEILQQKNIHVTSGGAVSATFIKSSRDISDNNIYLRYAHGIVSEYLMDNLSQKLLKYLCLPEDIQGVKRKSLVPLVHETKKVKMEENKNVIPNILDLSKPDAKPMKSTISSKGMERLKAASGSKTISSYFRKK